MSKDEKLTVSNDEAKKHALSKAKDPIPTNDAPPEPVTEEEVIFKAVASLRNRAKKLSPGGRERLFAMVRSYIG